MQERKSNPDLTVIMPCKDEEVTVGICVDAAKDFMRINGICGEVLVVDNASVDRSAAVAREHGARVAHVKRTGYGRALRAGLHAGHGTVFIMGDCDCTYNFREIMDIYEPLASAEYDMVIGDRFAGGIERGAMPRSHKWGVGFLSFMGRVRFGSDVRDFHCGLRGITRTAAQRMKFQTTGMEFATEMIALGVKEGLRIGQVPVRLYRCKLPRRSKLRTVRDGLRHLRYILSGMG